MRIQILALLILNNCGNVTPIKDVNGASTSYSTDENGSSEGVFTSTEFSTSLNSTSSSETSSGTTSGTSSTSTLSTDTSDTSSTSSNSGSTGEPVLKCNKTETGECNVFVASQQVYPDMGVQGFADFCHVIACNSGIAECGNYKALIREDGQFWERFADYNGSWILPSGKSVALGNASLEFANSINENEFGVEVANKIPIWTGFAGMFVTCFNVNTPWFSKDLSQFGDIGIVGGADKTWYTGEQVPCNTPANIICVEVE